MELKEIKKQVIMAKQDSLWNMFSQIQWGESYTSLLLGIVVVILASIILASFTRNKTLTDNVIKTEVVSQEKKIIVQAEQETKKETLNKNEVMYVVATGDTLWNISEKYYQTGFKWGEVAKANNIKTPENLEVGTKLKVPTTETKILATSTIFPRVQKIDNKIEDKAITANSYKIQQGDDLWDIAVRAYGDGYKWPEIAKANNLENPDIIHADNTLKIPR